MKLTKISLEKIQSLLRYKDFRSNPIKVLIKMLKWEVARLRDKKIKYKFDRTLKITLNVNEGVSRLLYYFGYSEPEIFSFINYYLKEGMFFFDIGANIGLHSLFASKRVGIEGKVFAFEPCKSIYKRIIENIGNNNINNIYSYNLALGDVDSEAEIIKITNDTSRTHIQLEVGINRDKNIEKVRMTTLDNYVDINNIYRIDYLKIDVEGYELNVLKGSVRTFSVIKPSIIQVEFDQEYLNRNNVDIDEIKKFFQEYSYHSFSLNSNCRLYGLNPDLVYPYNTFFIHKYKITELSYLIELNEYYFIRLFLPSK